MEKKITYLLVDDDGNVRYSDSCKSLDSFRFRFNQSFSQFCSDLVECFDGNRESAKKVFRENICHGLHLITLDLSVGDDSVCSIFCDDLLRDLLESLLNKNFGGEVDD